MTSMLSSLVFTFFALLTVASALGVVASRNTVNAAMCLLLCLAGVAGLFVRLDAYLLAFLLILVYAGAVVTLFLFIVMLLDVQGVPPPARNPLATVAGLVGAALVLAGLASFWARGRLPAPPPAGAAVGASLKAYAYPLFTTYLLPVQIVGFLLLIAMLGVVVISRRADP